MKPSTKELQEAVANEMASESAYHIEGLCSRFGLQIEKGGNPWNSKRSYIIGLLKYENEEFLINLAIKVQEYYQSNRLKSILDKITGGVTGEFKNIIFAANGPKPDIILRDATNNDIQIIKNEEFCLVYDQPIPQHGLLWNDLVEWWSKQKGNGHLTEKLLKAGLYQRLLASLDSPPEKLLFKTYMMDVSKGWRDKFFALIPQVYLHYDPYTIKQRLDKDKTKPLKRQRMDFLLLFSNRQRIVIEIDGQQHYSQEGVANPALYAEMVTEDRRLKLAGYEVYRFGGYEFLKEDEGKEAVIKFFSELLRKYT